MPASQCVYPSAYHIVHLQLDQVVLLSRQTMEDPDILLQICSHLDNSTLEKLSRTSLWRTIKLFIGNQHFWYLRLQHLLGRTLQQRLNQDWKNAYYYYLSEFPHLIIPSPLVIIIQLEMNIDPSRDDNQLLKIACKYGYTSVVELLLRDSRTDPSAEDNYCIKQASDRGHNEVTALLLRDWRVNPTAGYNYCIVHACVEGHEKVVELLLRDGRVNPCVAKNLCLKHSVLRGHTSIVRLLLNDKRVDCRESIDHYIKDATTSGREDIVDLLLKKKGIVRHRGFSKIAPLLVFVIMLGLYLLLTSI